MAATIKCMKYGLEKGALKHQDGLDCVGNADSNQPQNMRRGGAKADFFFPNNVNTHHLSHTSARPLTIQNLYMFI